MAQGDINAEGKHVIKGVNLNPGGKPFSFSFRVRGPDPEWGISD